MDAYTEATLLDREMEKIRERFKKGTKAIIQIGDETMIIDNYEDFINALIKAIFSHKQISMKWEET
jgi:hypothetical protein